MFIRTESENSQFIVQLYLNAIIIIIIEMFLSCILR